MEVKTDAGADPLAVHSMNSVLLVHRYDLRIRYIPVNFLETFKDDRSTLLYFYQQVSSCSASVLLYFSLRLD